jgi:hypothetical protein
MRKNKEKYEIIRLDIKTRKEHHAATDFFIHLSSIFAHFHAPTFD